MRTTDMIRRRSTGIAPDHVAHGVAAKRLFAFAAISAFAALTSFGGAGEYPSAADERAEMQKTWRLLERDIAHWDKDRTDVRKVTCSPKYQPPADQCFNAEALIHPGDRDPPDVLLRRSKALAADVAAERAKSGVADAAGFADGATFSSLSSQLDALAAKASSVDPSDGDARFLIFSKVMRLRRRIAFANPLVRNIRRLLFIGREVEPPNEYNWGPHICDQFFGFHAKAKGAARGNGLYVVDEPFAEGRRAVARSILFNKKVEKGPLKGNCIVQRNGWDAESDYAFLSPDVSWDGNEVVFSATKGENRIREWDDATVFHIFRCRADGSGLVQLTSGPVNDLFPCWLPNGRIVFCSERRGGYGRCHQREVPTFTLHTMFPDGSDITCISPHETNEFEPSVDNDGRIVYMRWDYVDRGFNQAHHAWTAYPDGRDPRELQGNTRTNEWIGCHAQESIRAVPGSRMYVATACSHHSLIRGSLVLIDPSVHDDGGMSQIRRLTPDQLFPESETTHGMSKYSGAYATDWPLSEKYHICVYDGDANCQYPDSPTDPLRRKYDVTLLDAFGNKICIYSHPTISCFDPMPLQARPIPPVIPHRTLTGRPADADGRRPDPIPQADLPKTAVIQLMNVYNSRYPFPKDAAAPGSIKALRVWEVLPKTMPYVGIPRLGACDQTPGRQCLGTVPVEEDGSAAFEAPVGVPLFFQALDADGCAVQTMRSDTYVAPGETLTCNGCHESREERMREVTGPTPAALRRAPSRIVPEPDGSKPYNYPRLVQGVLDAKCISCHGANRKEGMPDLRRGEPNANPFGFYTSFTEFVSRSLVKFYTNVYSGPKWNKAGRQRDPFVQAYSVPGENGALASRLYRTLKAGHHGVKLTDEEMRRLVVFMDAGGAYIAHDFDAEAQKAGKIVEPIPAFARKVPVGETRLEGPWRVEFPKNRFLTPSAVTMQTLVPWRAAFDDSRKSHSARARHFSGTATYHAGFVALPECAGSRVALDLGRVETQAVVRVNGAVAANLVSAPYVADITQFVRPGLNDLEIAVTSSDTNVLIYNAAIPGQEHGGALDKSVSADAPLVDNGLLGPVSLKVSPGARTVQTRFEKDRD